MKRLTMLPIAGLMLAGSLALADEAPKPVDKPNCSVAIGQTLCAKNPTTGEVTCSQFIDMDSGCYRYWNDDVQAAFDNYDVGCFYDSATLSVTFRDVNFYGQSAANAELDVVEFGSALDVLKTNIDGWDTMTWDVTDRFRAATGDTISFAVNVDAGYCYNDPNYWGVFLDKAVLTTHWFCGVTPPPPGGGDTK